MQNNKTKTQIWAENIGWYGVDWVINISILILAWNYLCADFFGMVKMSIPNAIGILIIKNVMFLSKQKKPESDIQFYHN